MKALITDGKNAGRVMHLTEAEIDLSDVVEKDGKTGAYKMTEADANWVRNTLREGAKNKGELSSFDKHQKQIALSTLKMSDAGANVMGGMSKKERAQENLLGLFF